MSLSKKEIHRLVDALPERDVRVVKQFVQLVLRRSQAAGDRPEPEQSMTLVEAASILDLTPRRLRELVHEGVIPANKVGRRWLIEASELQDLLTPEAREFLSHPLEKDDLAEDEKAHSEEGWREHLAGQTTSLNDYRRKHQHEAVKR